MDLFFKSVGALGIVFVSLGVLKGEERLGSLSYLLGGICLELYSIYLGDEVFVLLQGIFIFVAAYKFKKVWARK